MNILFVGISIPPELESFLKTQSFSWETLHSVAECRDIAHETFDLVLYRVAPASIRSDAEALSSACSIRYLAAVLFQEQDPEPGTDWNSVPIHAIWTAANWKINFVKTAARLLQEKGIVLELEALKDDIQTLHGLHEKLGATTHSLVGRLEKDIESTRQLQSSILQTPENGVPGVKLLVKYFPSVGRGGDYYDVMDLEERRRMGVLLVDSQTHGAVASILDSLIPLDPKTSVELLSQPMRLVDQMMLHVETERPGSRFSLWYGVLDRKTLKMRFCSHGSIIALIWRNRSLLIASPPPIREKVMDLEPGDRLLLLSDGIHQLWPQWASPITGLLRRTGDSEMRDFQNELLAAVDAFKETKPLTDDLTCLQLQVDSKLLYSIK
jgi:hypothetical protein